MIDKIRYWFEKHAFGVCEWWGKKLGIKTTNIRMYFIYLSFSRVNENSEPFPNSLSI